jgi:hypothetical protein
MDTEIPRRGIWDHIRGWLKALVSLIPYVGGAAAEILEQTIPSPLEKHRDEWMSKFADRVIRLEENLPPDIEFSANARKIAEAFVRGSKLGRSGDPQLDKENVRAIVGVPDDKIAEAVSELEEQDLVERMEAIGMGSLRFFALTPTDRLFVEFDHAFMGWDARDDAEKLARLLYEREDQTLSCKALCTELEWTPRRFNPAISVLIRNKLVRPSNTKDLEYITPWVSRLPKLGLALRQKAA